MKRMIHALLAAAVLVSAMTCTAFAATEGFTEDKAGTVTCPDTENDPETFVASYDQAVVGKQYVLLVVKADENGEYGNNLANADNILYIDQKEATSSTITFDVKPMAVDNSVVILGGGSEPVELGSLIKQVPPYVLGNVNGDKNNDDEDIINTADALLILQYVVELITLDDTQMLAADVNHDGTVNTADALRILQYQVELINYDEMIAPAN